MFFFFFSSKFLDVNTKEEWGRREAALQMGINIKTQGERGERRTIDGEQHRN